MNPNYNHYVTVERHGADFGVYVAGGAGHIDTRSPRVDDAAVAVWRGICTWEQACLYMNGPCMLYVYRYPQLDILPMHPVAKVADVHEAVVAILHLMEAQ